MRMWVSRFFLIPLLVPLFSVPDLSAATSGADFLKNDVDAYAAAAAGTLSAGATGPVAALATYNQAGLTGLTNSLIGLGTMPWLAETLYFNATWAEPLDAGATVLGMQLLGFTSGTIDQYDNNGYLVGNTSIFDLAIGVFAAVELPVPGMSVGGAARFIVRDVHEYSLYGVALDAAFLWRLPFLGFSDPAFRNLSLGVTIRNLGPNLIFSGSDAYENRLPSSFNVGIRWQAAGPDTITPWLATEWGSYINEGTKTYRLALGLAVYSVLEVVVGYRRGNDLNDVSFGTSLLFPTLIGNVRVDYAFVPLAGGFDPAHAFSLSLAF